MTHSLSIMRGIMLVLLGALPQAAHAQYAGTDGDLNDVQRHGKQLFAQHCGICHERPTITTNQFGPVLFKATVDGKETAVREFIKLGTQRMPGFRYYFQDGDIDSIVQFLKTLPEPEHVAPAKAGSAGGMNFD